ncbi:hypothetical protein B1M_29830, partial [Burkholderia sp. TJI49]
MAPQGTHRHGASVQVATGAFVQMMAAGRLGGRGCARRAP